MGTLILQVPYATNALQSISIMEVILSRDVGCQRIFWRVYVNLSIDENVQSSSCIIRWHEIRYRRSSLRKSISIMEVLIRADYVGCQTIWWGVYANLSIDWKCSVLLLYRIKTRATWRSSSVPKKVSHGGDGTGCGSPLYVCRPQSTSDTEVNICQCQAQRSTANALQMPVLQIMGKWYNGIMFQLLTSKYICIPHTPHRK